MGTSAVAFGWRKDGVRRLYFGRGEFVSALLNWSVLSGEAFPQLEALAETGVGGVGGCIRREDGAELAPVEGGLVFADFDKKTLWSIQDVDAPWSVSVARSPADDRRAAASPLFDARRSAEEAWRSGAEAFVEWASSASGTMELVRRRLDPFGPSVGSLEQAVEGLGDFEGRIPRVEVDPVPPGWRMVDPSWRVDEIADAVSELFEVGLLSGSAEEAGEWDAFCEEFFGFEIGCVGDRLRALGEEKAVSEASAPGVATPAPRI